MVYPLLYEEAPPNYAITVLRTILFIVAPIVLLKYFLYMVISPWHDVRRVLLEKRRTKAGAVPYNPRVSVLIPVWNEEVGILATLRSIAESRYRNVEVVVVNDGSADRSDEIIRAYINEHDRSGLDRPESDRIAIKYYAKPNGGKGSALNAAIGLSTGEILVSIDADCVVLPRTLERLAWPFRDPEVMGVVGNVKIGNTQTLVGVVQYLEFLFSFYFKKADSLMNTIYIIGGAAGAFRRTVFDRIGLYSTKNITEDIELSVRMQHAGMKIVYADEAIVYTEGADRLKSLMSQRLRWKRGRFQTFADYRQMFFSLQRQHNKMLTWTIFPLVILEEISLSFELCLMAIVYVYSVMVQDFSLFYAGIAIRSGMFLTQIVFYDHKESKVTLLFLTPVMWLLLYISAFVETTALYRSVWGLIRKKEVKWQRWNRSGVFSSLKTEPLDRALRPGAKL